MGTTKDAAVMKAQADRDRLNELEALDALRKAQPGWNPGDRIIRGRLQLAYQIFNERRPGELSQWAFNTFTREGGMRKKTQIRAPKPMTPPDSPAVAPFSLQNMPAPAEQQQIDSFLDGFKPKQDTLDRALVDLDALTSASTDTARNSVEQVRLLREIATKLDTLIALWQPATKAVAA